MSADLEERPATARRPGELGARELARFLWRQLCSMRTALILLLMLALAAVPGSVIPQSGVNALKTSQWKDAHPTLAPIYDRLGLFSVYDSPWFAAIYLLLMLSLVGCIVPRLFVYWRGFRADPPATPRNLARLADHRTYETDDDVDVVLARARERLGRRHRLRAAAPGDDSVSAERGYLREVGNLLFHLSVLIVLAGFAVGGLLGYQGGVVLVKGDTFANTTTSYDDFDPGSLFKASDLNPFSFKVDDFDVQWLNGDNGKVTARKFNAQLSYADGVGSRDETYDLRVNHPLGIGGTDLFLIGHGYAPVVTVRDADGNVLSSKATVFLPEDQTFTSFGVIKVPSVNGTKQIGLDGLFLPNDDPKDGEPFSYYPDAFVGATGIGPLLSMSVYAGNLGLDRPQSVYQLDTSAAPQVLKEDGKPFRLDIRPGETQTLPDGLGTVTFDGIEPWVRIQISQTPGKRVALLGVVMALIGLLGSLFIRPRRVWVRARREGGVTMVEVAALDRSGGGEVAEVLDEIVADLQGRPAEETLDE